MGDRGLSGAASRLRRRARLWRARRRTLALCTIATRDFLPWAMVLLDSLARHHPGASLMLLYVTREGEGAELPLVDGVTVVAPGDLVDADTERMLRRRYNAAEFCFALKPRLLRHLLDRCAERAVYLDSDIHVVGPLDEALVALESSSVVLTPHLDHPLPVDGRWPSDVTILRAGACNLGFAAVVRSAEARRMLEWWGERTMRWGFVAPWSGYQGDQKWMDMAATLFPGVGLLRDPGSNVAYWNLHSRHLQSTDGRLTANGCPLAFVHLSGFDPLQPEVLSKYQNRLREEDQPVAMGLARDYANRILAASERMRRLQWTQPPPSDASLADASTWSGGPMPVTAYRANIAPTVLNGAVEICEEIVVRAVVTNEAAERWQVARGPAGEGGVALTWHLRDSNREVCRWDNRRYFLPRDLAPGESIDMVIGVQAPDRPGRYFLEFDLVHEGIGWFGNRGTATAWVETHVGAFFESAP